MQSSRGFTLIELVVAIAIIGLLSGALVYNFRSASRSETARVQTARTVESDVRRAQSLALAGTKYRAPAGLQLVCAYGFRYVNPTTYQIYVRRKLASVSCSSDTRAKRFISGVDAILERKTLTNSSMAFRGPFPEIFFELPYAKIYIAGSSSTGSSNIGIVAKGTTDPTTRITVDSSGRINITP